MSARAGRRICAMEAVEVCAKTLDAKAAELRGRQRGDDRIVTMATTLELAARDLRAASLAIVARVPGLATRKQIRRPPPNLPLALPPEPAPAQARPEPGRWRCEGCGKAVGEEFLANTPSGGLAHLAPGTMGYKTVCGPVVEVPADPPAAPSTRDGAGEP